MRKVLVAVILSVMVLSLSFQAPGQTGSNSLDAQLIQAAMNGDTAAVQQLLQQGAHIEAKDVYGNTALIWAASRGKTDVAKLLLDRGANVEAREAHDYTALFYAVGHGETETVKLLLDKGANTEAKNLDGETVLVWAVSAERTGPKRKTETGVVKLLLEKGANVNAKDGLGYTARDLAARNGYTEVVRLMEQALLKDPRASFAECVSDFQRSPNAAEGRREMVIKLAASLPTPPAIPEEARQLFLQASALIKQTSSPAELGKPIELLNKALLIAPWWGNAYYNLSRALELSGQYDEAVKQVNYYIELKPSEADATEARAHISVIQAEKEAAARKKQENENVAAVKYVSGGVSRVREGPEFWNQQGGVGTLYTLWIADEAPFYVNAFRMPSGHFIIISLVVQVTNGAYAGDKIGVWDSTTPSCTQGGMFAFGAPGETSPCGAHYKVSVTNPPNATVTVTDTASGASVTLPVAILYRARAIRGVVGWGADNYQLGTDGKVYVLTFDRSVVNAAQNPNVNAMGLTPTSVTPYRYPGNQK